jgi:hypothetical protein
MKLNTINVIEIEDGLPISMTSFSDDAKGNAAAEKLYGKIIKELYPNTSDEDVEDAIEEGWFAAGDYCICLVHSI